MARQADPKGTRQMALKTLRGMTNKTRAQQLAKLRTKFPAAAEEYLKTLWATFRREAKEDGSLIEVFSIKETKDGKPVDPYLKSEFVFNPPAQACKSPETAKIRYAADLDARLQISETL